MAKLTAEFVYAGTLMRLCELLIIVRRYNFDRAVYVMNMTTGMPPGTLQTLIESRQPRASAKSSSSYSILKADIVLVLDHYNDIICFSSTTCINFFIKHVCTH